MHRWLRMAALAALALSVLTACTVSFQGGLIGGGLSLLGLLLLLSASAANTGCQEDVPVGEDAEVGPCLSPPPPEFGPCLTVDAGPYDPDAEVGPCLSPPPPEFDLGLDQGVDAELDMELGGCLSVFPEEDLGPPDEGASDTAVEGDIPLGPCLSPPAPDMDVERDVPIGPCLDIAPEEDAAVVPDASAMAPSKVPGRRDALEKVRVVEKVLAERSLPADVIARLKG